VVASNVVTLSYDRSGRVTRAKEKTTITGLWKNMDFRNDGIEYRKPRYNQIILGVCGNRHLSDYKGLSTKIYPSTFRL